MIFFISSIILSFSTPSTIKINFSPKIASGIPATKKRCLITSENFSSICSGINLIPPELIMVSNLPNHLNSVEEISSTEIQRKEDTEYSYKDLFGARCDQTKSTKGGQ